MSRFPACRWTARLVCCSLSTTKTQVRHTGAPPPLAVVEAILADQCRPLACRAGLLFLTAKGEVAIRYYDLQTAGEGAAPQPLFCNQWSALGRAPTSGIALLPKRANDVFNVEIARVLRLTRCGADSARAEGWRGRDRSPPRPAPLPPATLWSRSTSMSLARSS